MAHRVSTTEQWRNAFRSRAFSAYGATINRSGALGADDGGPASIDQSGAHGTDGGEPASVATDQGEAFGADCATINHDETAQ